MHSVTIVGCGYTGLRLAARWLNLRHVVRGFGTNAESAARIAALGAVAGTLDLDLPPATPIEVEGELVFYTVPPAPAGNRDERLERLLHLLAGSPRRVVYLSTTGVYGDRGGAVVDENTPPEPLSPRAVRRLAAESTLRAWAEPRAISWSILRVPGIYGPDRLPLERLRRADPAITPRETTPTNRIHVDDLVTACMAAGNSPAADRRIYNVTDGSDESLTAFLQRVARLHQLPPPPLISRAEAKRTLSASTWSFLDESRRVGNRRMLDELGVVLAYDDLDAGILACSAERST
jgi:nucleoside-diphosphate-sugar epimerase